MIKPISVLVPLQFSPEGLKLWVQKRDSSDKLRGLLEFPGGKVEEGENPEQAAKREVLEETGVTIPETKIVRFGQYQFPPLIIFVHLFEDGEGFFSEEGYIELEELSRREQLIPPNNIRIIGDLNMRLQGFSSLK